MINLYPYLYHDIPVFIFFHDIPVAICLSWYTCIHISIMIYLYPYFYHDIPVAIFLSWYTCSHISVMIYLYPYFCHDIPVSIFLSKQKNEWGSKRINLAVFHFLDMKIYSIYIYVKDIFSDYCHTVKVWAYEEV